MIQDEANSNWSSGLSIWDRLHGTMRLNGSRKTITIGVPAYSEPADVTLPKLIAMPFRKQRSDWEVTGGIERQ